MPETIESSLSSLSQNTAYQMMRKRIEEQLVVDCRTLEGDKDAIVTANLRGRIAIARMVLGLPEQLKAEKGPR